MKRIELLTREEFEKHGFIYEPDKTKCKSRKLKMSIPPVEMIDEDYKMKIVDQIPYKYLYEVIQTPNPYENSTGFFSDPRVLVTGHTSNGK